MIKNNIFLVRMEVNNKNYVSVDVMQSIIKINNKMQQSRFPSESACKNHPELPSGYFVSDQPWIKYCKNCALNVALSGRRIEKQLSPQEFQRKMQISTAVSELKNSLNAIEQTNDHYRKLTQILEEVGTPLVVHIKEVETALRELSEAKEKLQKLYAGQIAEKVHSYYEKQSKMAMLSLQVKKELQSIQSNFGNLIEMAQNDKFSNEQQKWQSLLQTYKKEIVSDQEFNNDQGRIISSIEEFYHQLQNISSFKVKVRMDRCKSSPTCEEFDMVLTPIDGNSLTDTITFDQMRLSLKPKGPLKLKTHKKLSTERDFSNNSKTFTKRNSMCGESHFQTIRRTG